MDFNNFYYIIILLLITILAPDKIEYNIILSFIIIFLILSSLTKNIYKSAFITILIVTVLNVSAYYLKFCNVEHFSKNDSITQGDIDKLTIDIDSEENENNVEEDFKKTISNEKYINKDSKDKNSTEKEEFKSQPAEIDYHSAQKQTYQLIDTVKILENTIKDLSPTLIQGKKIIEALDNLNL